MIFVALIVLLPIFEWLGDHEFWVIGTCATLIVATLTLIIRGPRRN